jgi:hypothetical protein
MCIILTNSFDRTHHDARAACVVEDVGGGRDPARSTVEVAARVVTIETMHFANILEVVPIRRSYTKLFLLWNSWIASPGLAPRPASASEEDRKRRRRGGHGWDRGSRALGFE